MKRRIFAVLLMALMLSAVSMPIVASAIDLGNIIVQPQATAYVDGGLVGLGGNQHYLWIYVNGNEGEYKTGTSTLYRQKTDGSWEKITSVSASGYSDEVENKRYLTLTSGYYKVTASATTSTGSGTVNRYYNI